MAELNEIGGASLIHLLTPDEPGLPEVTVSPQIVSLEAVNGATSPAQTVTVTNTGTEPLTITGVALGGPSGDDFNFSGPGLPLTLDPQQATTIDVTYDAPNGFEGVGQGRLFVQTNDPLNPTGTAYLFGLSKDGFGGGAEPSLQYVFDSLGLGLDVGDNNPNTPIINSSTPFAAPLGPDELTVEIFTKADSGPVIVEPLAAYAPDANPDEVGWHIASDDTTRTPLFGVPAGGSQQLAPPATGDLLFNPGGEDFGFYSQWPFFSDRLVYTEDLLNTWDSQRHHARIYPYRLLNGEVIDNWYIVAIEEHDSGWDYQDIVLLVKNVEPADARVRFESRDWQTLNSLDVAGMEWVNTWLTFNTITNPVGTRPFHDEVTLRIHNDHPSTPLDITGLTFSDPTTYLFPNGEDAALPVTIPGGGCYDLLVKFDRDTGVRGAYIDSLTIETTDPNQPTSLINLGGGWQEAPEGDFEYHMREIVKAFGYTTNIDDNDGDGEQGDGIPPGTWEPAGEEVLSRFWRIANPDEPMYVRQLAAFHGSSGETAIFAFDDGENRFLFHDSDWYQSLLPLNNNIGDPGDIGPAEITELGNTSDFEAVVSGNRACDAPCTTHGIRWWPVRDPSGKVVPDVFVFTMDYVGGGGANFDYIDNAYLVTNVEPVSTNTDISMALGYSPAAPFFGDAVTVTATGTNETVVNAIDVAISELDIDGSFSVQSVTPSQGTCDDAFIPITCDLGNIAGGDSVTVEVELTSGQEGTIDVQATATSLGEVNLNNNTAQLSYYVLGQIAPRITILKDAQPDGAQSFAFTGGLGAFSLTDNGGTQPNTFFVQYNFQPSAPPPPPGFAVDDGSAYGPRDNGETYGWFKASDGLPIDAAGATRERNRDGIAPELDTIIHMRRGDCCSGGFTEEIVWEHDLPNGFYEVTVSVGDEPDFGGTYNADHVVNAEGQNVVTFLDPSEQQEYATGTLIVEVTDGRLTLDSVGGFNTKINYVTIQGVSLPDNQAAFLGLTPGTYTITESDTPGWSLDDIACTGGTFTYLPDGVEVTVDFADRVTCTFTNSEIPTSFTLLNPSFEQELSGNWALNSQGDGDTRFAYAGAQSGSHVMLFTASGSTEFIRQTVPVTGGFSGDSYTLSFYIGGQNLGTGGAVGARLEFLNGGDVVNRINCTAANRGTFNWQLITCPPATAAGAYDAIRITLGTQGIAEGLLGFDSVVLSLD
ncbi:MAG: choice-of-anchor D domain-containing protein [Anaerolineae bacterium]